MKRAREEEEDDEYSLLYGALSWCRGPMIGQGTFGSVYRADMKKPRAFGSVVAVKSADPLKGGSLLWEKTVLDALQGCPHVIQTFGADTTKPRNSIVLYNVLLEFASGGSLYDLIVKSGCGGLSESDVRKHTKSMLVGLKHIHDRGFVHCDLKPDNVLLVPTADGFEVKIADFGVAKKAYTSCETETPSWRGTPWYLAPECVIYRVQEAFSDIWALGCTVLEMLTGKLPLPTISGSDSQIVPGSVPHIPDNISKAAQDFLRCCFEINFMDRMTADALLDHPFLVGLDDTDSSSHVQLSKEEAANAKRIKCSPLSFPFGCGFIPLSDFSSQEAEVPEIGAENTNTVTSFPFSSQEAEVPEIGAENTNTVTSFPFSSQEAEVPEIRAENINAVTSFPFGCSFIPLPDSSSKEGEEEEIR
ncbi:mitogen-activated protein kinase kinase kinase 20-like [Corylus avellana]|uniref:mitogen-activated protein kinase kinase kinase 20-like n=1 Tax=Corylus avellana TaxID=13451 RepID=UPI001E235764|nr:mitogen-activated protein kinase kinase kinase 20-like [Corylus avellana]